MSERRPLTIVLGGSLVLCKHDGRLPRSAARHGLRQQRVGNNQRKKQQRHDCFRN